MALSSVACPGRCGIGTDMSRAHTGWHLHGNNGLKVMLLFIVCLALSCFYVQVELVTGTFFALHWLQVRAMMSADFRYPVNGVWHYFVPGASEAKAAVVQLRRWRFQCGLCSRLRTFVGVRYRLHGRSLLDGVACLLFRAGGNVRQQCT